MQTIDITTERDECGEYSFRFTLSGQIHEDHGFTTRERALEAARSEARISARVVSLTTEPTNYAKLH